MTATLENPQTPSGSRYVLYRNFTGINAVDLAEDIERDELAVSVNTWSNGSKAVFKRPGSSPAVTANGQPPGQVIDMISARLAGATYLVILTLISGATKLYIGELNVGVTTWTLMGTVSSSATQIFGAEMYDPDTGQDTLFITDGVEVPWRFDFINGLHHVTTGIVNGSGTITSNPVLGGGGNLIVSVAATGASATTTFTVLVTSATTATITDSQSNSIVVAPSSSGTIDMVTVTLGAYAVGDVGKTGTITITQSYATLPKKPDGVNYITPLYVATLGNNSHLFYSGENTVPTGVYISDPTFPERFNNVAMQVNPYAGSYLPAIIGLNDGVNGGNISGLCSLQGGMVVFKQSAIYVMVLTTLLGEVPVWQVYQVSFTGTSNAKAIVAFEVDGSFFAAFQAIDGIYVTTGLPGSGSNKISGSLDEFFDPTYSGFTTPMFQSFVTAVRCGNRYAVFGLSNGSFPGSGAWFDFTSRDRRGNPKSGFISGVNPLATVALRGPSDTGTFAWADAGGGFVGVFGSGYTDYSTGQPASGITMVATGKADTFEQEFGQIALAKRKQVEAVWVFLKILKTSAPQSLTLALTVVCDGSENVGNGVTTSYASSLGPLTAGANAQQVYAVKIPLMQGSGTNPSRGRTVQVTISEVSNTVGWALIGYAVQLNEQLVDV